MPKILVISTPSTEQDDAVTLEEVVEPEHFESPHHAAQLIERVGWAVTDAKDAEDVGGSPDAEDDGVKPMDYMRAVDRLSPLFNNLTKAHPILYRVSGGMIGHRIPGGPPMLLLHHVGSKSGRKRTTPLVYLADGVNLVIVASKGGHPRHPAWFHNLRANPATTIQVGSGATDGPGEGGNPRGTRAALAEGCPGVQRLCRLSGARRAGDQLVILEPR